MKWLKDGEENGFIFHAISPAIYSLVKIYWLMAKLKKF